MLDISEIIEADGRTIGYRDRDTATRRYLLPTGLEIVRDAQRQPAAALFMHHAADASFKGAALYLRLRLAEPARTDDVHPILWSHGLVRTLLPDPGTGETLYSDWRPALIQGDQLVLSGHVLPLHQAEILAELLRADDVPIAPIAVELVLACRGWRRAFPARCELSVARLYEFLSHELPPSGNPGSTVRVCIRRFLSQHDAVRIEFSGDHSGDGGDKQDRGATLDEATRDDIHSELAERIVDTAFEQEQLTTVDGPGLPATYALLAPESWRALADTTADTTPEPHGDTRIFWDLRAPRPGWARWATSWNLAELWQTMSDEQRRRMVVWSRPAKPLDAFPIFVENTLPIDGERIRRVRVTIRRRGDDLEWQDERLVFEPDSLPVSVVWGVHPLGTHAPWQYQIHVAFGRPEAGGWPPQPIQISGDALPEPRLVITAESIGVGLFRVQAPDLLFRTIGAARVELRPARLPDDSRPDSSRPDSSRPDSSSDARPDDVVAVVASTQLDAAHLERLVVIFGPHARDPLEARVIALASADSDPQAPPVPPAVSVPEVEIRPFTAVPSRRLILSELDGEPSTADTLTLRLAEPQDDASGVSVIMVNLSIVPQWQPEGAAPVRVSLRPADPPAKKRFRRPSVFTPLSFRYQAEWLLRQGPEAPGVLTIETEWLTHEGEELLLRPPEPSDLPVSER